MSFVFTLTQLTYFAAVARSESMTAAAESLNVTQPTLSAAIRQLEASLGIRLFVRTHQRRMRLSVAGRQFLLEIDPLLVVAERVNDTAQDLDQNVSGELVVGVYSPLSPFRVAQILKLFTIRYPEVRIKFVDGNLASLQRMILEGECDFTITYALDLDARIQRTVLDRVTPYILLPEGHPLAGPVGGAISLESLQGEPFILLDLPHAQDYYLGLFEHASVVPNVRYRADYFETVRSFVGAGLGYTILHQGMNYKTTYEGGRVTSRTISNRLPALEIVLAHAPESTSTKRVRAFELTARSVFGLGLDEVLV